MDSFGACQRCTDADESNTLPVTVSPIGDHVVTRDRYRTKHSFGQCTACGSIWVTVRDAGSSTASHRRLTDDLF